MREIGWSNNIVIMEKCKDDLQRKFYIQMALLTLIEIYCDNYEKYAKIVLKRNYFSTFFKAEHE